jgi:hypothetical protein
MNEKSSCKLDHSLEDVKKKQEAISAFLSAEIAASLTGYLQGERSQDELNHVFHLLKKYDLAGEQEKQRRNAELTRLFT